MNHRLLSRALATGLGLAAAVCAAADQPLTTLPYTPGLDVSSMDTRAAPCEDFYQYACGGWMQRNPIPPDQARWDVYSKLADENKRYLWGILEGLAGQADGRTPAQQQIGDLYASCMDETAVQARGTAPLAPWRERIAGMRSLKDLPGVLAAMHLSVAGGAPFAFDQNPDFGDSSRAIGFVMAGGLSLPDRDDYLSSEPRMREMRARFVAHVARMFELDGMPAPRAGQAAMTVLSIESELAAAMLTRVQQREPSRLHHVMDLAGLQRLAPHIDWAGYFQALGAPAQRVVNVTEPAFLRALDAALARRPLAEWQTYLHWHALHALADKLPRAFDEEHFAFFSQALRGVPQPPPRWRRCVNVVDALLGDALGQEFVRRTFGPEQKRATERMAAQIEQAMARRIQALDWMTPATKARALEKLSAVVNKVGYPDRWIDYASVRIARDDFAGNVRRATEFDSRRELAKIGKPVDRVEWSMTPPTVNAYYNPQGNDINFPAGVLQPPLYDPKMDAGPNYGNTGGTIGHELIHGFDDEGRQFDARGNLRNWWTPRDEAAFNERAQCLVDQYAQYPVVDDIRINSRLTLGEDLADLGGLVLALMAWQAEVGEQATATQPLRDGLTPLQRFFVGFAQWACENTRPEELRIHARVDPHSPGRWRVNGLVVNLPEFQQAFACRTGQPMAPARRCRVW
ncbi:M13 family metallopeptidase [Ideonella sp.]|uniref:M13 family metallopeptidase n=1 Tax=Ideonella sp. TaxID=1929293 RepID=UPI0035B0096E